MEYVNCTVNAHDQAYDHDHEHDHDEPIAHFCANEF